ncbi:AAA family ATPase [Streptomyces sp. NL15-2K]|uniref:AAA family ATPase n=1 Tax=Streptomyces sp. NL15-2K TaxID=376149 RepID=UPI000F586E7D|nr:MULTISPECIES: AAA family ATPase [Actinomycetes]WKX13285.1 MoxR family ATPase [Kutzneria buriramensis]GCB45355.1 moxR-like ATPases [Streptomyces sp. NL15-2K]
MTAQEQTAPDGWRVFHATGQAPAAAPQLPSAPPWRRFRGEPLQPAPPDDPQAALRRLGPDAVAPQLGSEEIDIVNAALLLRRPLLITGPPGIGKSTLAYVIARELGLGRVLEWNIVSRTTLRDGLYSHDAMGRAQAIAAWQAGLRDTADSGRADGTDRAPAADAGETGARDSLKHRQLPPLLGDFITLGPLGTALLPYDRPRVLLVDELDKSDIDLPNDLLHVLENGSYDVPELVRDAADTARVHTSDPGGRAVVRGGRVECREFPVVVITSNGEREFPAAFRRRCLPLELRTPTREQLLALVERHLGDGARGTEDLVDLFLQRVQAGGVHSLDQLLNAVQITTTGGFQADGNGRKLVEMLLRDLAKGR